MRMTIWYCSLFYYQNTHITLSEISQASYVFLCFSTQTYVGLAQYQSAGSQRVGAADGQLAAREDTKTVRLPSTLYSCMYFVPG